MNAEEIRRAAEDMALNLSKREFIDTLAEELYRVPFRTADVDVYPVKVERFGKNGIEIHLSDDSVFRLTLVD